MSFLHRLPVLLLVAGLVLGTPTRRAPTGGGPRNKADRKIRLRVKKSNIIDLTYVFDSNSAYWPSNPSGFELVEFFRGFVTEPFRYFYSGNSFSQPEHLGTHMDAPIHFYENGVGADGVDLDKLIGRGVLVNLKSDGENFPRESNITRDTIRDWERANKKTIRPNSIVLFYTGYGDNYYDRTAYYGTNKTGVESVPYLSFPGLDPDAAEWLIRKRNILAVGIDTASIDHGQSQEYGSHQIFTKAGIPIFENVGNLNLLAEQNSGFTVIALPQKIGGGSGAPLRIIAVIN